MSTFCQHSFQRGASRQAQPSSRKTPDEKFTDFLAKGCGCSLGCYKYYEKEHYTRRSGISVAHLTHDELDSSFLGKLWGTSIPLMLLGPNQSTPPAPGRDHVSSTVTMEGRSAKSHSSCFMELVKCLLCNRLTIIIMHYRATGLTTRQHGNTKRTPHNALSFRETQNVVKFLHSYAESNAILLPGRIPGYKRDDLQLLPSSTTKKVCLQLYSLKQYLVKFTDLSYYLHTVCLGQVQVGVR